ncbi:MAG: hypothetical protein R2695_18330 [Acidimicrobiales bacterium]
MVIALGEGGDGLEVGTAVAVLGGGGLRRGERGQRLVGVPAPDRTRQPRAGGRVPVNYGTAWFALHDRAGPRPGETVLVTGAAGERARRASWRWRRGRCRSPSWAARRRLRVAASA